MLVNSQDPGLSLMQPFNLSIRNSAAGIADLCRKTGCQNLFVTPTSAALRRLALDAREELMKEGIGLRLLDLPSLDAIYPRFGQEVVDDAFEPLALPASVSVDSPCLYLHSSGSTSFPKPIPWTHAFCIRANSWVRRALVFRPEAHHRSLTTAARISVAAPGSSAPRPASTWPASPITSSSRSSPA